MPRITIACPAAMRSDANHLGAVLGRIPQDATTYGEPIWQDAQGNLYACASLEVSDEWLGGAWQPLQRPAWDTAGAVDMEAAARAQAALVFSLEPVAAAPTALTAIAGMSGPDALAAMGLTPAAPAAD